MLVKTKKVTVAFRYSLFEFFQTQKTPDWWCHNYCSTRVRRNRNRL